MTHAFEYIGTQVMTDKANKRFLGEVVDAYNVEINTDTKQTHLIVKHFNGEPWPFDPIASEVTVLEREPA